MIKLTQDQLDFIVDAIEDFEFIGVNDNYFMSKAVTDFILAVLGSFNEQQLDEFIDMLEGKL